jgi:hypothetical protein
MCGLNSEPEIQAAKSPIKNLTGLVKGDIVRKIVTLIIKETKSHATPQFYASN